MPDAIDPTDAILEPRGVDSSPDAPEVLSDTPATLVLPESAEEELHLDEPSIPRPDDEYLVEAVLFASTELVTVRQLRELVDAALSQTRVQKLVESINLRLRSGNHPFEVTVAAGGWR